MHKHFRKDEEGPTIYKHCAGLRYKFVSNFFRLFKRTLLFKIFCEAKHIGISFTAKWQIVICSNFVLILPAIRTFDVENVIVINCYQ